MKEDFPNGPVVNNLPDSQGRRHRFNPWEELKIQHGLRTKKKKPKKPRDLKDWLALFLFYILISSIAIYQAVQSSDAG